MGKRNLTIGSCVRWAGGSIDTKNNILYVSTDQQAFINYIVEDSENKLSYYHGLKNF